MQYVMCSLTLFPLKISVPSSTVKFRVQSTNSCGDTGWGSESAQSITLTQFSVIYKSKSQAYIAFLTSTRSELMQKVKIMIKIILDAMERHDSMLEAAACAAQLPQIP